MSKPIPGFLTDVRILSLALNLPGPAALMRCAEQDATCIKLEPPSGDAMRLFAKEAYSQLHERVEVVVADLKTEIGQSQLHQHLANADILLTSFRPSALRSIGLDWTFLRERYPKLSQVMITGAPGDRAEEPGHDLTYLAEHDLVESMSLPPTLYADMSGALLTAEAIYQAALHKKSSPLAEGILVEVALSDAAQWLALPRGWGLTTATGAAGGAHAGYGVYACVDGRVAVAALEPVFARALCAESGISSTDPGIMFSKASRKQIAGYFAGRTRTQIEQMAVAKDVPLMTMAKS